MPDQPYRPPGVTTITAYLCVRGAAAAIDFYKQAFGAQELFRMAREDSFVDHATLGIGDSALYLSDEDGAGAASPQSLGGSAVTLHMYVPDCDAVWERAIAAGGTVVEPMADQEWGDRWGLLRDPFGHLWGISTMRAQD